MDGDQGETVGGHGEGAGRIPTSTRARAFYEGAGWHPDGEQRQQQLDGVDVPEARYRLALIDGQG
jgi:hypothetical protein